MRSPKLIRPRPFSIVGLTIAALACNEPTTAPDAGPTAAPISAPALSISDAANGGRAGFYFLPPLVRDASPFPGTFDATLQPTAKICTLNAGGTACVSDVATFPFGGAGSGNITVDVAGQSYNAIWSSPSNLSVSPGSKYRLAVYVNVPGFGNQLVGYLDIWVVAKPKDLKNVPAGYYGHVRGTPLTIKFRIEQGAVGIVQVLPASATILVGGTQAFTATVYDLDGNVIAAPPTVAWASSNTGVATVSASGVATGIGGGTASINATSGGVTGQASLTVIAEVAPAVTTTVPADAASNIAVGSSVTITFNEAVTVVGDWFDVACAASGTRKPSVAGSVAVSGGPTTFTLDPSADFAAGESCTVTVYAAQVTDQDANDPPDNMAANYVFAFSTADNAPFVSSTTPVHQATDVAKNTNITINFSESVNVSASSFTLACPDGVPKTFALGGSSPGTSFTLDPDTDLPGSTLCKVTVVAAEVTDADTFDPPDAMAADFVITFTTAADAVAPDAKDDNVGVGVAGTLNGDLTADNGNGADILGSPAATLTSFGGGSLGGTVTSNAAGASVALAGGTLTVNGNGTFSLVNPTIPGTYTFLYRLTNASGTDDATVTVVVTQAPDAKDDALTVVANNTLNADVTANNGSGADILGSPAAAVASFGGGSLGGAVTGNAAGAAVSLAGGTLTLNANGTLSLTTPTTAGVYTFLYRLTNSAGSDDATVTITVSRPPVAKNDAVTTAVTVTLNGNVTSDNGSGADDLGVPTATVTSFGGGSLPGTVTTNAAGASVALAGGTLTVNANGTFSLTTPATAGVYTFLYRLTNSAGTSDATVTVTVTGPPTAVDDAPAPGSAPGAALHGAFNTEFTLAAPGLLANDNLGVPAGTITKFGKIQGVGSVDDNNAGSSATFLTTGSLTVNADGSVSLTPPTGFTGYVTFEYRVTNSAGSDVGQAAIAIGRRPVATSDTYTPQLVGNVAINTATSSQFSVLTNDAADALTATLVGSPNGTTVIDGATGKFSFDPNVGFEGAAAFTYKTSNGFGDSPSNGTVSLTVGQPVWFVNSGAGVNGDGRFATPFNCLTGAGCASAAARDADDRIFLYSHANTYVGGITLQTNERVIGQGATGAFGDAANLNLTWPADAGTVPTLGGTLPTITSAAAATNGLNLGTGNTLRGFSLGNATGIALFGSNFGTLTVSELGINTTGQAISLTTGTLAATFTGVTSAGGANNVFLSSVAASGTVALGTGALSGATGGALGLTSSSGAYTYGGTVAGAIVLAGGSANLTLSGNVSQTTPLLLVSVSGGHTGTLTMTGQVSGTNSGGLQFANADGTYDLQNVAAGSALTGGATGIQITGGSAGTFTFGANLSVTSPTGTAFFVDASSATVTMNGPITQNNAARGVFLQNNTGGTVTFTGALTLNTTTQPAFEATTAGPGAAGTVTVQTSTTNVLSTTTGTPLRVNNVNIGAGGLRFRSVSANGAANGIVLNNTGTSGGLTVAGNGGVCTVATPTCTGGNIHASTGAGIDLANTSAVSLTLMRIGSGADDGIRGSTVTGFSLANGLVTGNGNALNENGLDFSGLFGTASVTNSVITGSFNNNAAVRNSSGTLTMMTVTGSTFSNNASVTDGDGLLFEASGTANMSLNASSNTFSAHHSDHFQAAAVNSGVLNVVFTGNTLSGGHAAPLGQGITINAATGAPGFAGSVTYDINGNTINGAISNAIMANLGTSAAGSIFKGQIRNNIIGTTGQALSCSTQANGINVEAHGNGTHTASVTGNTLKRCADRGINSLANDGNGALNLTVTGNSVTEMSDNNAINGTPREAFLLVAGSTTTNVFGAVDSHAVCLNLTSTSGNMVGGAFKTGDIRVRQRFRTSVRLPGYAGAAFDAVAVVNFLQANNPGAAATATANDDAAVVTDGFFGGAACTLP